MDLKPRSLSVLSLLISLLAFLIPAAPQAGEGPRSISRCELPEVGGVLVGVNCYCPFSKVYVDPGVGTCIEGVIHFVSGQVPDRVQLACSQPSLESELVPAASFCADPIRRLCSVNANPYIEKIRRAKNLYYEIANEAERDPKVQKFVRAKSAKARFCRDLKLKDYEACARLRYRAFAPKVFTEKRKKIARALFEKARGTMLRYLAVLLEKLKELPKSQQRVETLKEIMEEVRTSSLHFGPGRDGIGDGELNFDAFSEQIAPGKSWIRLEAEILDVDEVPEEVYFTFLHELAHIFDGTETYADNPFLPVWDCLTRHDAVAVKLSDESCLKGLIEKYQGNPKFAAQVRELRKTAQDVAEDPRDSFILPKGLENEKCQLSQLGETTADWVATAAYASDLDSQHFSSDRVDLRHPTLRKLQAAISWSCMEYLEDEAYGRASDDGKDSHPNLMKRIRRIYLADPRIRKAMGCPDPGTVRDCGKEFGGKP